MNMADIVLILGNGFDIDLGLKSKYSDFAKSDEWSNLYANKPKRFTIKEIKNHQSLLEQIREAKYKTWFDLEEEIYNFVRERKLDDNINQSVIDSNKQDFISLKDSLKNYLIRQSEEYITDTTRLSFTILQVLLSNKKCHKHIFSFNYTDCLKLCKLSGISKDLLEYTHIHGSLNEDLVLGCEVYDGNNINKNYSFLYKYNMLKRPNKIVKNLLEAKEVIFFGHSINEMDFCYFREYFKAISTTAGHNKNLTIICKDETSEINIKDNIRSQGIIVTDLYNNLNVFGFIHTDMVYAHNDNEMKDLIVFLNRIKKYQAIQGIKTY